MYLDDRLCKTLLQLVGEKIAYFVGGYPSKYDLRLAVKTGFAFLGSNHLAKFDFADEILVKSLLREEKLVPLPPLCSEISGQANVVEILATHLERGSINKPFRLTILKEAQSRGIALLNVGESQEVRRGFVQLKTSVESKIMARSRGGNSRGQSTAELRKQLQAAILKSFKFCFYPVDQKFNKNPRSFFENLSKDRGIIEMLPSVMCLGVDAVGYIESNGKYRLLRIFEALQTINGNKYAYLYPQIEIPNAIIEDLFGKVAKAMIKKGGVGWITVSFEVFNSEMRNDERSVSQAFAKVRLNTRNSIKSCITLVRGVDMTFNSLCSYCDLLDFFPPNQAIILLPSVHADPIKGTESKDLIASEPEIDPLFKAPPKIGKKARQPNIDDVQFANTEWMSALQTKGVYFDFSDFIGVLWIGGGLLAASQTRARAINLALEGLKEGRFKQTPNSLYSTPPVSGLIDLLEFVEKQAILNKD